MEHLKTSTLFKRISVKYETAFPEHQDNDVRMESPRLHSEIRRNSGNEAMGHIEPESYFQGPEITERPIQEERQITASPTRQESIGPEAEWPSLDNADKPVQFFRQFETINSQRENLQHLRIRLREDRRSMKLARQKFLEAASEVLRLADHLAENNNGYGEIIPIQVQDIAQSLHELEQEEFVYDGLEGDLIPAEYGLKESEEELYGRTVGMPLPRLIGSDIDKRERQPLAPSVPDPGANDFASQDTPDAVAQGRSLQIRTHRQQIEESLAGLDVEHAHLSAEAARRSKVGASLDEDDQFLLDSYVQRRGRLWNDLARIDRVLAERALMQDSEHLLSGVGAEFDKVETLPILNELVEAEPGVYRWRDSADDSGQVTPDAILRLGREDFEGRENIFQQSLAPVSKPQTEIFPGISLQGHHSISDSWFESVCDWLLQCAESSWSSFDQFFRGRFEEENLMNYKLLRDYLYSRRPTALFMPAYSASQDLESLNSWMLSSQDKDVNSPEPAIADRSSLHSSELDRRNS